MVNLRPKNDRRRRNWRTSDVSLVASELWFDRGRKPATCCSVIVVKSPYEFEQLRNKYLQPEQCGQILGFDAEWVSAENYLYKNSRNPRDWPSPETVDSKPLQRTIETGGLSLVQLSTCKGVTLLCRVGLWASLPRSFIDLMEDRGVLKVGVQPESDAKQLADTFHVRLRGTVDLRHVVVRHPQFQRCSSNESSLKAIGAKLFGIKFPLEHMRFRLSNWNALELESQQLQYAAMDSQLAIDAFWHCAPITFNFCPDEYLSDTKSVKMSSDDRSITALLTRNPSPHSQVFPVADLHTACEILVSRCRQIVEVNFVSDEMTKTRNLSGIFQKDDISVVNLMATNVKSCRNCSEKKEEEEKKEDADLIEINFNESSGGTTLQEVDSDPVKEHHNWDIEDECLKRAEEVSPDELFRIYQQMFLAEKSTLNMTLGQNQEYHMEFACSTTPLKLNRVQSQQLIGRTRSSPLTGFGRANRRRLPLCSSPLSPGVSKPLEFLGAKSMFFQADLLLDTPDSTADSTLGPSPLSVTRTPRSSPLSSPSDPQSSIAAMSLSASPSEVRADPPPSCFVINNNKHKQLDEVIEENSNQNVRQSPSIPVCLRDPFDLEVLALLPASWSLIGSQ